MNDERELLAVTPAGMVGKPRNKQHPCKHPSADGTGNPDEWCCGLCGEVFTTVVDPDGPITMGDGTRRWRARQVTVRPAPAPTAVQP